MASTIDKLFKAISRKRIHTVECMICEQPELLNTKANSGHRCGISTPLIEACYAGSLKIVKLLLDKAANVCETGYTTRTGDRASLALGIYHEGGYGAYDDIFPLFIATKEEAVSIVEELMKAGAPVNQKNAIGQTALHRVCMNVGKSAVCSSSWLADITQQLLEHGANVNVQDANGITPLHYACIANNHNLIALLLDAGADITIRDNRKISVLEMAARVDIKQTEMLINRCDFSPIDIIEAYEMAGASTTCEYYRMEILTKASKLRMQLNIPKVVLEPLECYGFMKEWETLEELYEYRNENQLKVQSLLARERIFEGRYVSFGDMSKHEALLGYDDAATPVDVAKKERLNSLLQYRLDLLKSNGDYFFFINNCIETRSFSELCRFNFTIPHNTLTKLVKVAFECCTKMQEELYTEKRAGCIMELITQLELSLFTVGSMISQLFRKCHETNDENAADRELLQAFSMEMLNRFPLVFSPFSRYRAPLSHILFGSEYVKHHWGIATDTHLLYQKELMKMFINAGLEVYDTDSDGNTLLHVVISCFQDWNSWNVYRYYENHSLYRNTSLDIVELLLENGTYPHARNSLRKSALESITKSDPINWATRVKQLFEKYDQFPTLQHIAAIKVQEINVPYFEVLPQRLVKFVDLH